MGRKRKESTAIEKPKVESSSKPGPKPMQFSAEDRARVEVLAGCGATVATIASIMGCSADSLEKHCRHELDIGHDKLRGLLKNTLAARALAGDTACLIFACKTMCHLHEVRREEISGPEGKPIEVRGPTIMLPAESDD